MLLNQWNPKQLNAKSDGSHVHIERYAWEKMFGWCRAAESEVSGIGIAKIVNGTFIVSDVFFPKQYCSSAYTEADDIALGKINYLVETKKPGSAKWLRFWWHTHYNFNTFWSGTDDANAQGLANANGDWALSLVINQHGDWRCRVDFVKPVRVTLDELEVFLIPNSTERKPYNRFKQDVKKWVKPLSMNKNKSVLTYRNVPEFEYTNAPQREITYPTRSFFDPEPTPKVEEKKPVRFGKYILIPSGMGPDGVEREFVVCVDDAKFFKIYGCTLEEWNNGGKKGSEDTPTEVREEEKFCTTCYGMDPECVACAPKTAEKACDCDHDGIWESCICHQDCNKCYEKLAEFYS